MFSKGSPHVIKKAMTLELFGLLRRNFSRDMLSQTEKIGATNPSPPPPQPRSIHGRRGVKSPLGPQHRNRRLGWGGGGGVLGASGRGKQKKRNGFLLVKLPEAATNGQNPAANWPQ